MSLVFWLLQREEDDFETWFHAAKLDQTKTIKDTLGLILITSNHNFDSYPWTNLNYQFFLFKWILYEQIIIVNMPLFILRCTISIYSQKYFKTKLNFKKNVKSNNFMPKWTFNLYVQAYTWNSTSNIYCFTSFLHALHHFSIFYSDTGCGNFCNVVIVILQYSWIL